MKKVTLIKGDGIGPEITDSVMKIINAVGVAIDWDIQTAGADLIETEGTPLPQRVLDSVKQNKIALFFKAIKDFLFGNASEYQKI